MAKVDSLLKRVDENAPSKEALDSALLANTELNEKVALLTESEAKAQAQIVELTSKLQASEAAQADFEKRVQEEASKKAQEIVASVGHKPVATRPAPAISELKGLAKAIAAQRAESQGNLTN